MGQMSALLNAEKQRFREERDRRVAVAPSLLSTAGLSFRECDSGFHLIIYHGNKVTDFWPSRGKWMIRNGRRGRGLDKLLAALTSESTSGSSSDAPGQP